jgi:hypothetical protein
MIVSDKNVSDALTYLADDPHPLALARKDLTDAENLKKQVYAECFLMAEGSIEVRKAHAETNERYIDARNNEADAILELERHKARTRAAEMLLEIWRSENANVRAAERVR